MQLQKILSHWTQYTIQICEYEVRRDGNAQSQDVHQAKDGEEGGRHVGRGFHIGRLAI